MSTRPETFLAVPRRARAAGTAHAAALRWRPVLAGPVVALATFAAALIATHHVRVPFRDPDDVAARYLALVGAGVVVLAALDVAIRAGGPPSRAAMARVRRERWTPSRALAVGTALVSFYVSY